VTVKHFDFTSHVSVLLNEVRQTFLTDPLPVGPLLDGTFGGGGHSLSLLEGSSSLRVVAFDQDPDIESYARSIILERRLQDRLLFIPLNFSQLEEALPLIKEWDPHFQGFSGALLDLGISSHQLTVAERGLSFQQEGPLDMRMNYRDDDSLTAADILRTFTENELNQLFWTYGEERYARQITRAILRERAVQPLLTTTQLADLIKRSVPPSYRYGRIHPATRIFQALRIEVNGELAHLEKAIVKIPQYLSPRGKMMVLSFHSLEDRIVKHSFKALSSLNEEGQSSFKILTKRPLQASDEEIQENPRARSVKARILEKV
jgi:16S rRNA (cytosine1402-N4)-methyltransferase